MRGRFRRRLIAVPKRSRRHLMKALFKSPACVILAFVLSAFSLLLSVGPGQPGSLSAISLAGESPAVVVETTDTGSFQAVVSFAESHGLHLTFSNEETHILSLGAHGLSAKAVDAIREMSGVTSVSSERKASVLFTPNDSERSLQWGLNIIHAYGAWDITMGNHSVVVAVLDTGIDWTHPDLAGNMWSDTNGYHGFNFISDNRLPMDDNVNSYDDNGVWEPGTYTYHGTHVAGVVGAVANNNQGIAGMAQVQLMAVKVMNDSGEGTDAYVASGIRWAVDPNSDGDTSDGADIITMSLGVDGMSTTLGNAVNFASSHGVVLVAATGNSGSSVVSYPAAYPKVIGVGAVDSSSVPAGFSNYGNGLDVMAPGTNIYSTMTGGAYQYLSGTSTAAPFVAGIAALMLTVNPALTPKDVGDTINTTSTDIRSPGWDDYSGWGVVDAFRSVEQVSSPAATITKSPSYVTPNSTFSITWMVTGGSPGVITSTYLTWGESPTSLTEVSATFTGQTWASFTVDNIPALPTNGTLYLQAVATVDGTICESEVLELPVHEPTGGDLFTQFLRDVRKFIIDDLGLLNFMIILGIIIAIPLIIVATRPRRRKAFAKANPQLAQYKPIPPAQYLPPPPPPPPRFESYIDLMGGELMPASITVFEGTKVVWVNRTWAPPPGIAIKSGTVDQSGEHPDGVFQSGMLIAPGDYWSATFHKPGVYPYYITGIMRSGKVVVETVKPRQQGAS
jgi:subtilisin family serine protease